MGHTNSTANLSLPQFIGTDKPTWLGDVNGAFSAIDSYAGTNDAAVAAAVSDASSAISQAAAAVNTANTANTTAGNASTAATAAVTAANQANALSNQIALRTGVLADLHTTDKTSIVNAINEVNGKDAGDIAYNNTGSGLTATNVQAAIDEVAQVGSVEVTADGVKTNSQLLDDLFALIDISKLSGKSAFSIIGSSTTDCFNIVSFNATRCVITQTAIQSNAPVYTLLVAKASASTCGEYGGSYTDISSAVATSGTKFKIEY